jgi:hypothetical protein
MLIIVLNYKGVVLHGRLRDSLHRKGRESGNVASEKFIFTAQLCTELQL